MAVGILGIVSEVVVVVILSLEKVAQWTHFSDDIIDKILLQISDHMLNVLFLLWAHVEYTTSVMRPNVVALSVQLSRVVNGEEYFEEDAAWDDLGVECYLDNLSMACALSTNLLVGWVFHMTTGISRDYFAYSAKAQNGSFDTPKATATKDNFLDHCRGEGTNLFQVF